MPGKPTYVETSDGVDVQLVELFNLLELLPEDLQALLSGLLLGGIERIVDGMRQQGYSTLGADRLLVLYSLERLWPGIPKTSPLHKALKASLTLDEMGQSALCYWFYEPTQLVSLYVDTCQRTHRAHCPKQVQRILSLALADTTTQSRHTIRQQILAAEWDHN